MLRIFPAIACHAARRSLCCELTWAAVGPFQGLTPAKMTPLVRPLFRVLSIYLDTYMLYRVYDESGIRIRNHCGAEPPRDIEPSGLVTTVGGRDRASASYAAADRVEAPASAARGRFRGIQGGRTAPPLPAET